MEGFLWQLATLVTIFLLRHTFRRHLREGLLLSSIFRQNRIDGSLNNAWRFDDSKDEQLMGFDVLKVVSLCSSHVNLLKLI